MVEELVALRGHEVAVEPEQPAEGDAVVHLDRLVGRAEALELARAADEEAPLVREVLRHRAGDEVAPGALPFIHAALPAGASASAGTPPRWMAWNDERVGAKRDLSVANTCSAFAVLSVVKLHT